MSALRSLQRGQLWNNTSGYICHSCRSKLQLQLGRRQLTRSQTHLSTSEGSGAGGDDWFSNFNDLSDVKVLPRKQDANKDDLVKGDSFRRIPSVVARRTGGDGEEIEKGESSVAKTAASAPDRDALSSLVDNLEKKVTPPPRASRSRSFSRPSMVTQDREIRDKARQVRIRLNALERLEITDPPKAAEVHKRLKEEEPRLYGWLWLETARPPLAQVAEGTERNGINWQAEKMLEKMLAEIKSGVYPRPNRHHPIQLRYRITTAISRHLQSAFESKILAEVAGHDQTMADADGKDLGEHVTESQSVAEDKSREENRKVLEDSNVQVEDAGQKDKSFDETNNTLDELHAMILRNETPKEDVEWAVSKIAGIQAEKKVASLKLHPISIPRNGRERYPTVQAWKKRYERGLWNLRSKVLAQSAKAELATEDHDGEGLAENTVEKQNMNEEPNAVEEKTDSEQQIDLNATSVSRQSVTEAEMMAVFEDEGARQEDLQQVITSRATAWAEKRVAQLAVSGRTPRERRLGTRWSPSTLPELQEKEERDLWKLWANVMRTRARARAESVFEDGKDGEGEKEEHNLEQEEDHPDATLGSQKGDRIKELMFVITNKQSAHEEVGRAIIERAAIQAKDKMSELSARSRISSSRRTLGAWEKYYETTFWKQRARLLAGRWTPEGDRVDITSEDLRDPLEEQDVVEKQSIAKQEDAVDEQEALDEDDDTNASQVEHETFGELMSRIDEREKTAADEHLRRTIKRKAIRLARKMVAERAAAGRKTEFLESYVEGYEENLWKREYIRTKHSKEAGHEFDSKRYADIVEPSEYEASPPRDGTFSDPDHIDGIVTFSPIVSPAVAASPQDEQSRKFEETLQQLMPSIQDILAKAIGAKQEETQTAESMTPSRRAAAAEESIDEAAEGTAMKQVIMDANDVQANPEQASSDVQATFVAQPAPISNTDIPVFAKPSSLPTPDFPAFPNAKSRIWSEWDTPIPSPKGAKPPPQKPPAFARSLRNPFTSPVSPLSTAEPLSLAKQVEEANSRPKWGGVSATSRVEPLSPRSAVSDVVQTEDTQAEIPAWNAPFKPFGLDRAAPTEVANGNVSFLDSLQRPARFDDDSDVFATTSSKALRRDKAKDTKNVEASDSKTPLTSWLWNKLVGKTTTEDKKANVKRSKTTTTSGAAHGLDELQQKLSGDMKVRGNAQDSDAVGATSSDISTSQSNLTAAVSKPYEDSQTNEQASSTTSGAAQVNEQAEAEETRTEADVDSSSESDPQISYPVRDGKKVHRPLDSGRRGALAELDEELVHEATSASNDRSDAVNSALEPSTAGPSDVPIGNFPVDSGLWRPDNFREAIVDLVDGKIEAGPTNTQTSDRPGIPSGAVDSQRGAYDSPASARTAAEVEDAESHNARPESIAADQTSDRNGDLQASERLASLWGVKSTSEEGRRVDEQDKGEPSVAITNTPGSDSANASSVSLERGEALGSYDMSADEMRAPDVIEKRNRGNEATIRPADESKIELVPTDQYGFSVLPKGRQQYRQRLMKQHLKAAEFGDHEKSARRLDLHNRILRGWCGDDTGNVSSSQAARAQGAATSESQTDSVGGHDSAAMGGNGSDGNDDSDDKPLWEVMSKAEALTNVEAASEVQSEPMATNNMNEADEAPLDLSSSKPPTVPVIKPSELEVEPLGIPQPPVPGLEYGLDRVLFNPGVYQLQDPLSRVYNFDPYLQKIMPVVEFDFNALKEYKTSSQDAMLSALANEYGKRYIGSTSSMTGMLGHFHYLLSDWRPLNLNMLSRGFSDKLDSFTMLNRAPNAIFLRWKNGTYAVDADKQYDSGNVLMLLGKSMEKLLTTPTSEYERYRKSDPRTVSEEERTAPEAFEYTTMGDFLMRSQLDAHDPRLPGTGMFDLKTRAVLSVRMDAGDFEPMTGYEIHTLQGRFGSYEREFYDMMRSTMLKYMLQARMGRMDGIFIAYHNVERIFGFQYLPIPEMDRAIHGQVDRCLGDQEFKTSLDLVNKIFDKATAKFPEQSLRFHFETTTESLGGNPTAVMWIFAEPMSDSEIDKLQSTSKAKVEEFERSMMGVEKDSASSIPETSASEIDREVDGRAKPISVTSSASELSSALSSASSEDITSHAEGDSGFLNAMTNASALDVKPLFAASLICKSKVNGLATQRPENLTPSDVWQIEYLLREWDAPDRMWPRYEQMKARRQEMFDKLKNEEEMGEGEGNGNGELSSKQKRERAFIEFLRSMSRNGRDWRARLDKQEAGKEPVIVGQPLRASSRIVEEGIGSVDQYTAWLYGKERS